MDEPTDSPPASLLSAWWADLKTALAFLTRLPIPIEDGGPLSQAARAFPLVGLVVGLIGAVVFALATWLGLPGLLAATLTVAATILATGALHEDGLADTADGFGGGADRQAKLAIMRDSRTGNYGVLALILSVLLRVYAIFLLAEPASELGLPDEAQSLVAGALVAAHALSRAALPAVMWREATAREDGLGVAAGRPGQDTVLWALGIAALLALVGVGLGAAIVAIVAAGLATAAVTWLARRQIGGYTGDTLGAVQQAVEAAVLLTVVAMQ